MNLLASQHGFDGLWERLDREAVEAKFSHQVVLALSRLYSQWDAETQQVAKREFGRWLHSANARKRFDALALVEQFSIIEADRDLSELKTRLEGVAGPEAAFELRRVNDVRAKLAQQADHTS